jgi:ABC-type methionine transport system permease subunit
MIATIVLLIVLVQGIQLLGNWLAQQLARR